jgi:hypothetical protein
MTKIYRCRLEQKLNRQIKINMINLLKSFKNIDLPNTAKHI